MKQLLLVRHAKSDWSNAGLDDFDRPLNERGKSDAPMMARRLLDRGIRIDAFIASPAKRAAKTAKYFAEKYGLKKDDIIFKQSLYHAEPPTLYATIQDVHDELGTIAIFAHNYGITDFANLLTDTRIDNIPTCGVFGVKARCDRWVDFRDAEKEFWFFDYPKSVTG